VGYCILYFRAYRNDQILSLDTACIGIESSRLGFVILRSWIL
jgi:hypothetical protein